ncbi:MAG: FISUMP domain-containing protein [Bacteroidales bacterium]
MKRTLYLIVLMLLAMSTYGQDKLKDSRDGNTYSTIVVNGKVWMAENLRFKTNGSSFFENDACNAVKYGALYDWKTANNVCPEGWTLPSGSDYRDLMNYYDQEESRRKKSDGPSSIGVTFGGMQNYEGTYTEMDESAYCWTSTEYDKEHAEYFSYMIITDNHVVDLSRPEDINDIHGAEKNNKYSVRCVKSGK